MTVKALKVYIKKEKIQIIMTVRLQERDFIIMCTVRARDFLYKYYLCKILSIFVYVYMKIQVRYVC